MVVGEGGQILLLLSIGHLRNLVFGVFIDVGDLVEDNWQPRINAVFGM